MDKKGFSSFGSLVLEYLKMEQKTKEIPNMEIATGNLIDKAVSNNFDILVRRKKFH